MRGQRPFPLVVVALLTVLTVGVGPIRVSVLWSSGPADAEAGETGVTRAVQAATSTGRMAEGFGADVQVTRTQTTMQGASHCDFRYALKKSKQDTQ